MEVYSAISRLKIDRAVAQSANRIRPFQIGSLPVFTQYACSSDRPVTLNPGAWEVKTGFGAMMAAERATLQQTSSLKKHNMVPEDEGLWAPEDIGYERTRLRKPCCESVIPAYIRTRINI